MTFGQAFSLCMSNGIDEWRLISELGYNTFYFAEDVHKLVEKFK